MKVNQKVRYGVACLFELAKTYGDHVDAEQLAERLSIPHAYAHKVLQNMAHAGIVIALKGVGYRLARPLTDITALHVMDALSTESDTSAPLMDIGANLERRIKQALDGVSLSELKIS